MRCIFKWQVTDGCTYYYDTIVPFECEDLDKVKLDVIEKLQKSESGIYCFGYYVEKCEIDDIEFALMTLDEWFESNKIYEDLLD